MKMMQRFLALASAVVFLAAALPSSAQTAATGSITGTVTEKTGAIVPGATVVITDTDTGATRTVTTNSDGSYVVPFLQSGHYEVVLGGGAYGKVDRKNLDLTVGATLTIDAVLSAASVSSDVVVTVDTPLMDTERVRAKPSRTSTVSSSSTPSPRLAVAIL
jgi:hypothetical protein